MDREKVIKGLEICVGNDCTTCPYKDEKDETYSGFCEQVLKRDILTLLKEQEAKPVIVTTNAYGTRFCHCPKCNRDLYAYLRHGYCSNCGQKLKWE